MRKRFTLLLTMLLAVALMAGLSGVTRAQDATLTVGFAQEPDTMNGYYSTMAFGQWAMDLALSTLWDYDLNAQPVLILGAEIPTVANGGVSADLKTYTIKLKSGLKWSDGTALTADDLKFTLDMIADKANEFAQATALQSQIVSAEKIDDVTVKATWKDPQPFPEQLLSNVGLVAILPKHVYEPVYQAEKTLKNAPENQNPTVFSGPFVLKEWLRGETLTFEANPSYVLGAPKIKSVVIRIFPDPEAGYAAVAAGQVDFQPNLGQADPAKVKAMSASNEVVTIFGGFIEYLVFNVRGESFGEEAGPAALQDVRVRQAVRLAIDRRAIVKDLLADTTTVTDSLYSGTQWEKKDLGFVEYDPAAAEKLLDEAGYKKGADGIRVNDKGERLEWKYSTTTAQWRKDIQAVIQQQLEKVGIKTLLESYPAADFFGQWANGGILNTGKYALGQFANNTVLTNIVNVTADESLGCDQVPGNPPLNPGGNNNTGWCNEEFDALIEITKTEIDAAKAQAAADKAQTILTEVLPLITLFPRGDIYVYNRDRFVTAPNIGCNVCDQWYDIHNWELK
jgi:peptide/nickel transport system substrate-binding protein